MDVAACIFLKCTLGVCGFASETRNLAFNQQEVDGHREKEWEYK